MRNYSIQNTKLENQGHELDEIARIIQDERNEYYIIGSDREIRDFYERTGRHIQCIKAFVLIGDDNPASLYGKPVVSEENIQITEHTMIICTHRNRIEYEIARNVWKDLGIRENKRFFQGELFSMIYDVYKRSQIRLDRIEIFLTSRCTLNCEKCIAYIPYFNKKADVPLEQLKQDADILFQKVDYIYKLKLLGGEGLLYPHLIEYVDYLHDYYREKIGTIRVGTNGTILPNKKILEMCKRNHVTMDISDYSLAVPEQCKLNEVKSLCENYGIEVEVKRTGEQWLDLGFPDNIHQKESEQQLRERFRKCAMFCRQFSQGKLWFCCTNFAAVCAGLFPKDENDYFDFTEVFSKEELLEYELGYSRLGHTTFCNVCGGCSEEVNHCMVEVAKQTGRRGWNEGGSYEIY